MKLIIVVLLSACLTACDLYERSSCEGANSHPVIPSVEWPDEFDDKGLFLSEQLDIAVAEFECGFRVKATERASIILKSLDGLRPYWDYPNAVHVGNTIIGLQYLELKDLKMAKQSLLDSVPDRRSPQLSTVGPSMMLAARIAKVEPNAKVLIEYLMGMKTIWASGGLYLDARTEEIRTGEAPKFGAQGMYLGR